MKRALLVWRCCFVAVFFFDGKGPAGTVSRDAELRFRMLSQEQEHAPVPFPRSKEAPRMLSAGQEPGISVILPCGQSVFLPPGHTALHTLSLKTEVLSGLETSGAKRKHPGLGILLSALVPGLGEFYV